MALNKYGIDDAAWAKLPSEDRNEIISEWAGNQVGAGFGGGIQTPMVSPPPPPRAETISTRPGDTPQVVWVYVRNASSFPGNHPDYADLKAHGVGGILAWVDDPLRDFLMQSARDAGLLAGIWGDPHGADATQYADKLATAASETGAATVAVDLEGAGKGWPGSPEWDYNQQLATAVRGALPQTPIVVTPPVMTGYPTDYNFGAWNGVGASVWLQTYGSQNEPILTPQQAYDLLIRNGVPPDKATVILAAGSLAQSVPQAQQSGLPNWAIWTIDDVGASDRTVPFGEGAQAPQVGGSATSPVSPYLTQEDLQPGAVVDPALSDVSDLPEDDADDGYDEAPEQDDQEWADFLATFDQAGLDEILNGGSDTADSGGLQFQSLASRKVWVRVAPGANRSGVPIHPWVIAFVRKLAVAWGTPLTITCGTNHNQYVKGSHPPRQSQHWTGDAADIGMYDPNLRRLGQLALILAGAKPSWARQQTGGAFTIRGVNILFDTDIGGNHFNHLHVGLANLPLGLGSVPVLLPGTTTPGSRPAPPAAPSNVPLRNALNHDWNRLRDSLDGNLEGSGIALKASGRAAVRAVT